ncbi:MAG: hypothetical protein NTY67_13985 [Cyanobacteria bacterium]|nr:hypothetical protein [Cyanobacteriota bacterium]
MADGETGATAIATIHPDCTAMLQRLARAGVRPVAELSPQTARRLGMCLYDLERQEGEASLLRQLMRLKSASSTQLAEELGRTTAEMESRLDRLYLSGSLFRQERQPGVITWSTRISQQRRTLQDRGLMDRLAEPTHATPRPHGPSDRLPRRLSIWGQACGRGSTGPPPPRPRRCRWCCSPMAVAG